MQVTPHPPLDVKWHHGAGPGRFLFDPGQTRVRGGILGQETRDCGGLFTPTPPEVDWFS